MRGYAYLAAHVEYRARRAVWQTTCTDMFPKWDKQAINLYPIGTRKNSSQRDCCLFRRRCVYISPAISDTVNVDIDSDAGLIASDAEHEVSALRADPVQ